MHRFLRSGDKLCVSPGGRRGCKIRVNRVAVEKVYVCASIFTSGNHLDHPNSIYALRKKYSLHVFGDLCDGRARVVGRCCTVAAANAPSQLPVSFRTRQTKLDCCLIVCRDVSLNFCVGHNCRPTLEARAGRVPNGRYRYRPSALTRQRNRKSRSRCTLFPIFFVLQGLYPPPYLRLGLASMSKTPCNS